jgi:surface antigen
MKLKHISAAILSTALAISGSVGLNAIVMVSPIVAPAQAQPNAVSTLRGCFLNEPFDASIAFTPTNIRQQPTTDSPALPNKLSNTGRSMRFSGINLGKAVNDAWDGQPDNMWYRIDGQGWVAGAVVNGYPRRGDCSVPTPTPTTNGKAENFFRLMVGVKGVTRYDTTAYDGQCVTLAVRYLQDVYFNGSRASRAYGNGKDVARGVASQHPNLFQFKTSGTPKRGAIISFAGGGIYDNYYGHVGIVLDTNGTSFTMLESNYDGRATQSVVHVSGWRNRAGVVGWADPVGNLP